MIILSTLVFAENMPVIERVADVEVTGNTVASSEFIIARSRISPGDKLYRSDIENAVNYLFKTSMFKDVEILTEKRDIGDVIIIRVEEYERISKIIIKGAKKIKEKELLDSLTVKEGEFASDYNLYKLTSEIIGVYREKGFLNASMRDSLAENGDGSVNLYLFIDEQQSIRVKHIEIFGNMKITDKKIKGMMKTKEKGFLQEGLFKEDEFEQDKKLIVEAVKSVGYPDARLDSVRFDYSYDNKFMFINIFVTQGGHYVFGDVTFSGNFEVSSEQLSRIVRITKGSVYDKSKLDKVIADLYEFYMNRGYLYVSIIPENTRTADTINYDLKIKENNLVYIRDIAFKGNEKTEETVIRREVMSKPGQIFKRNELVLTHSSLFRSGLFEDVQINPLPVENEDKIDIEFDIKEKQTGEFNVGVQYNQVDGFTGNISIKINNLLGKGLTSSIYLEKGTTLTNAKLGFTEPYLMSLPILAGSDLYYITSQKSYYYQRNIGGDLKTGFYLSERLMTKLYLTYTLENVYLYTADSLDTLYLSPAIREQIGDPKYRSEISPSIVRDSRNHSFFPTGGEMFGMYGSIAGGILGGEMDYYKLITDARIYRPIIWKLAVMGRLVYGFVDSYGDPNNVPLTERFILGGTGSWGLRGYPDNSIGPMEGYYVIGGRGAFVGNLELRLKLTDQAYLLGFYDIGNSWESITEAVNSKFSPLYQSLGIGARLEIPMVGVMGIDLGYGFVETENGYGKEWEPHFQIGTSF